MAVFKKHLTPIGKGPIVKHAGKGAKAFAPPAPGPSGSMNDYAKATPMANPQPQPPDMPDMPM